MINSHNIPLDVQFTPPVPVTIAAPIPNMAYHRNKGNRDNPPNVAQTGDRAYWYYTERSGRALAYRHVIHLSATPPGTIRGLYTAPLAAVAFPPALTIYEVRPRRDAAGRIIDAHIEPYGAPLGASYTGPPAGVSYCIAASYADVRASLLDSDFVTAPVYWSDGAERN